MGILRRRSQGEGGSPPSSRNDAGLKIFSREDPTSARGVATFPQRKNATGSSFVGHNIGGLVARIGAHMDIETHAIDRPFTPIDMYGHTHIARVWINRIRLPILLVVS